MKNWVFAATIFLGVTSVLTPLAHAQPAAPRAPKTVPFQGAGGRDISESAWQSWQAPVGTTDPERLIPSDSTNSTANTAVAYHFDKFKSDSLQLPNTYKDGKPIQVEESKPIEKIESVTADSASQPATVLAAAAPRPKSDSKRVLMIAVVSVAFLGYRKFRRANAGPYPPKPSFL